MASGGSASVLKLFNVIVKVRDSCERFEMFLRGVPVIKYKAVFRIQLCVCFNCCGGCDAIVGLLFFEKSPYRCACLRDPRLEGFPRVSRRIMAIYRVSHAVSVSVKRTVPEGAEAVGRKEPHYLRAECTITVA
ncbi:hypothetical protein D3C81_1516830 [compost metagenome]